MGQTNTVNQSLPISYCLLPRILSMDVEQAEGALGASTQQVFEGEWINYLNQPLSCHLFFHIVEHIRKIQYLPRFDCSHTLRTLHFPTTRMRSGGLAKIDCRIPRVSRGLIHPAWDLGTCLQATKCPFGSSTVTETRHAPSSCRLHSIQLAHRSNLASHGCELHYPSLARPCHPAHHPC